MLGLKPVLSRLRAEGGRRYMSAVKTPDNNAFSGTIQLPKTRFPLRSDPAQDQTVVKKTTEDLYKWQWENAKGPLFVLHDGPPYANGDLHIGHALNKIVKDIINRYHVSLGERVHYVPGWDCHGLPIEQKVLGSLKKDVDEVSSVTIRTEAEKYAKEQVKSQMGQFKSLGIMASWKRDTTYRTMDHEYEMRQLRIFQKMVERGLIFRQHRPVHYSPSSHSALAESELEYKDNHRSSMVYVAFELDPDAAAKIPSYEGPTNLKLLAWTTTPWTLTANMGLAVNTDMQYIFASSSQKPERGVFVYAESRKDVVEDIMKDDKLDTVHCVLPGSALLEARYRPLFSDDPQVATLPIFASAHVTPTSGTGVVHLAPAHGQEDYELFRSRGLTSNMLCHVDDRGRFAASVAEVLGDTAAEVVGKEVLDEGGKALVGLLRARGAVVHSGWCKHRYPYDWKTHQPIIMLATSQWFANLDAIKEDALTALKDVDFYPAISRNRLEAFVASRSEWCISRQRVWGVPIPALYHLPTGRAVLTADSLTHILRVIDEKGTRYWWDGPVADFVPPALLAPGEDAAAAWAKGTDTMDVWFDSGTSWAALEALAGAPAHQNGRVADVCVEGSDQHRGWFQSQLLTAVAAAPPRRTPPAAPYGALVTHGMVLDEHERKMSKSLGNIVTPATVIFGGEKEKAYGVEVLRFWAASVELGKDMSIGPTILKQCAHSYRKICNTARFLLGNLRDRRLSEDEKVPREQLSLIDRYVMHKLHELDAQARAGYSTYNFPKVVAALHNFANTTASSLYFDLTKDSLYCDALESVERRSILTVMEQILDTMIRAMAPILPHVAEALHSTRFPEGADVPSVFCEPWMPLSSEWSDPKLVAEMDSLLQLRSVVLALLEQQRQSKVIQSSLMADVDIIVPDEAEGNDFVELVKREAETLKKLCIVSHVNIIDEGSLGTESPESVSTGSFSIPDSEYDLGVRVRLASGHKCPRCWTYTSEEDGSLCGRCASVVHH